MGIKISDNLIKLAKNMDSPLYLVGGKVRDYYLNYENDDIDICSAIDYEKMVQLCKKLGYKVNVVNKRLGTLLINPSGSEYFEYTPFRIENYTKGNHSPDSVEFVDDIVLDAKRRDFSMNAIYINVLTGEVLDKYNGIDDIKNNVVKCVETPEKVFSSDGLRLLRLVRFASVLGFKIDKKTLKVAKEMTYQLRDISAERKKAELDKLVVAEKQHNLQVNSFIKIFNSLNIYKNMFLLPLDKYKIKLNKDYFNFFKLDEEYRFVGFMVLFLLNKYNFKHMVDNQVVFDIQNIMGNSLRCSNIEMKQVLNIYRVLQDMKFLPLSVYHAKNYHNLSNMEKNVVNAFIDVKPVSILIANMHNKGIPFNVKGLQITSQEIGDLVGEKNISKVQEILLEGCLGGYINNSNEELRDFIKNEIIKKKIN